jgi:hypothetical protein
MISGVLHNRLHFDIAGSDRFPEWTPGAQPRRSAGRLL